MTEAKAVNPAGFETSSRWAMEAAAMVMTQVDGSTLIARKLIAGEDGEKK